VFVARISICSHLGLVRSLPVAANVCSWGRCEVSRTNPCRQGKDVSPCGIKLFIGGTAAANQITGSLTIPANGWATFGENGWNVYDALGARMVRKN
jgi:hypothetical protein